MPASRVVLREVRRFAAAAHPQVATDRELLGRFVAARDGPAFAELVRRHGPMVLGLCRRVLAHAADADDAFQATFLILVRKAHTVGDPDRLGPWLYGVAWRTANKVRANRRSLVPLPDDLADRRTAATDWPVDLDAAIARLPDKYRVPVVLCHLQGLTPAEAAERLGCPTSTIATRLSRARDTLRKRLAARGLAVPAGLVAGAALHLPPALTAAVAGMAAGHTTPTPAARLAAGAYWSFSMAQFRVLAATALVVVLTGVGLYGLRAGGQVPRVPPAEQPPLVPPPEAPLLPPPALPATVTTDNFTVTGPSARIARLIADAAERARKDVAITWLEKELPKWDKPVPVRASIRADGNSGATVFDFAGGGFRADMTVEGSLDRLLADTIPHEVTHCVMADLFRKPLPRWADEGISLMSETEGEQDRHTALMLQFARSGDLMQTRALFEAKEYPAKVMPFFAQGFYVTKFLVARKDRPTFLQFVKEGMAIGWDAPAKAHYGFATLADLEAAYLATLNVAAPGKAFDPAPALSMASADRDGRITVSLLGPAYVPMTSYVQREHVNPGDKTKTVKYLEPVTTMRRTDVVTPRVFAADRVKALTLDGKPIDGGSVRKHLSGGPIPVVVTTYPAGIDPAFAAALKPGTLVLVIPAEKAGADGHLPPPTIPAENQTKAEPKLVPPPIAPRDQ